MPRAKTADTVTVSVADLDAIKNKIAKDFQLLEKIKQRVSQGGKRPHKTLVKATLGKIAQKNGEAKKKRKSKANDDDDDEPALVKKRKALAEKKKKRSAGEKKKRKAPASEDEADDEVEEEEKESSEDGDKVKKADRPQRVKPGTGARRLHRRLLKEMGDRSAGVPRIMPLAAMRRLIHEIHPDMRLSDDAVALMCASILRLIPRIRYAVYVSRKAMADPDNPKIKTGPIRNVVLADALRVL